MNSDIEKFLKGENNKAYNYFGSHKVSDGACFRVYAPNAKRVEVSLNNNNYEMEKIDFRGIYEVRVKDVREYDSYCYEILTNEDLWVNKNDPYTFTNQDNKSLVSFKEEYEFINNYVNKDEEYFNACYIKKFNLDEQKELFTYLKNNNFSHVIINPSDKVFPYSVNKDYINEASLKVFIDNLHSLNIGVILDIDTSKFVDYNEGLNEFDGSSLYNKKDDKYEGEYVYYDLSKNHNKSYLSSLINYYLQEFNMDMVLDDNLKIDYTYLDTLIEVFSENKDYKEIVNKVYKYDKEYVCYDYDYIVSKVKGSNEYKESIANIILGFVYLSKYKKICVYNSRDSELLMQVSKLYKDSKYLKIGLEPNLLLNGKKNYVFSYEFNKRNECYILFLCLEDVKEDTYDLGMNYYGYYNLVVDTSYMLDKKELYNTRQKKVNDKSIALKIGVKKDSLQIYKRMRDI